MKRRLIVCLAAFHLLGMTTASPVYAGSCPPDMWTYCHMWCMMQTGEPATDVCYATREEGIELLACLCPSFPEPFCDGIGLAGCSTCC